MTKSLKFSESYTNILTEELVLYKNACKSILYDRGNLWRRKKGVNSNYLFDVAQGSYLGAELCELVCLFDLSGFKDMFGVGNVGISYVLLLVLISKVHQQKFKSSKNIIKQLPNKINDQLNKRSSTEENVLKVKKKITNQ